MHARAPMACTAVWSHGGGGGCTTLTTPNRTLFKTWIRPRQSKTGTNFKVSLNIVAT